MSRLSKVLRRTTGDGLVFMCPGCEEPHRITVNGADSWQWDGNVDRPTITPSILVKSGHFAAHWKLGDPCWCTHYADGPEQITGRRFKCKVCHSYVTDGQIRFLDDCTHHLKGQTVPLPEWVD